MLFIMNQMTPLIQFFIIYKFNFCYHVSHLPWIIYGVILTHEFPSHHLTSFGVCVLLRACAQEHKIITTAAKVRNA